jgi:cytoplasmic iron level regulating protein YaaA (DUF328/UPF0246 family)
MLILISSAKTMIDKKKNIFEKYTQPQFLKEAHMINHSLRSFSLEDIQLLMQVNPQLARINIDRIHQWHTNTDLSNALQAIFAYNGEVYRGINVKAYNDEDLLYAQEHLRILSGLYGLLRPLDLILPYRLDMGAALNDANFQGIYGFWQNKITESIRQYMKQKNIKTIVNLASNEYFSVLNTKKLSCNIITPVFQELSGDKLKTIVVYLKKARGLMTSYIIKNRIENPEDLKNFNEYGYGFYPEMSTENKWVFVR